MDIHRFSRTAQVIAPILVGVTVVGIGSMIMHQVVMTVLDEVAATDSSIRSLSETVEALWKLRSGRWVKVASHVSRESDGMSGRSGPP